MLSNRPQRCAVAHRYYPYWRFARGKRYGHAMATKWPMVSAFYPVLWMMTIEATAEVHQDHPQGGVPTSQGL